MLRDFHLKIPLLFAVWVMVIVASTAGCVQRRMTIRTNPPGAQVYVDNHEIGRTPVSTHFIYYGSRNIRLVKDGYETLTVKQPIFPPWYQLPGIDFFVETFSPFEIRDERNFNYEMQPLMVTPSETLLARAEELRRSTPPPVASTAPIAVQPVVVSPYAVPPSTTTPYPTTSQFAPQTDAGYLPQPNPGGVTYAPRPPLESTEGYGGTPVSPLP